MESQEVLDFPILACLHRYQPKMKNFKGNSTSQKTQLKTKKIGRRHWISEEFMKNV